MRVQEKALFEDFCSHLKYIAQDFGQYHGAGEVGLQTGTWDNTKLDIVSDIIDIPLPDKSIDAIMCTEVLEHIPNPVAALNEFRRLLKPGGYLLITAPFASLTHFAPLSLCFRFKPFFFYEHHFKNLGFDIVSLELNGNYFEYIAQENRRIKMMASRYANTKLSILDKIIVHLNLALLQRLSRKDSGSSEILCYGVHVFARKH